MRFRFSCAASFTGLIAFSTCSTYEPGEIGQACKRAGNALLMKVRTESPLHCAVDLEVLRGTKRTGVPIVSSLPRSVPEKSRPDHSHDHVPTITPSLNPQGGWAPGEKELHKRRIPSTGHCHHLNRLVDGALSALWRCYLGSPVSRRMKASTASSCVSQSHRGFDCRSTGAPSL